MRKALTEVSFEMEVNAKINHLIDWIIETSPARANKLSYSDFADVRAELNKIANGSGNAKSELEPAEGGAQYVNVTPAPWP